MLPWILQELKNTLGKLAIAVNLEAIRFEFWTGRSVSDSGNLVPCGQWFSNQFEIVSETPLSCDTVGRELSGDCPSYMSQMLIRNADISERPSRHGLLNLVCPRFKRESEGGRSFTVSTTRLWNKIPSNIRNKPSLASFKKTMFDHFKDSYKHLDRFIF